MRRRVTALVAVTAIAGAALVAVGASPPARASDEAGVQLGLADFYDVAVDDAHGHLFFTAGPGENGVTVTDLEGQNVTVIYDQPGASGLGLSADGSRLFVGLANGDAISVIDTETLAEVDRYDTGADTCPGDVVATATTVWFGYGCGSWEGNLGALDVGSTTPAVRMGLVDDRVFDEDPRVRVGGDVLALGRSGLDPAKAYTYDVSTGTPERLANAEVGGNLTDMAVTPDGERLITASGYPYEFPVWRTADMSADGVYSGDSYPTAVELSDDGALVAAGIDTSATEDVSTYRPQGSEPVRTWALPDVPGVDLLPGGLAFSADTSRLYAVATYLSSDVPRLHVLHDPAVSRTTLTAESPGRTTAGGEITVSGRLGFSGERGTGAQELQVTRRDRAGSGPLDVTTHDDGTYSFTHTVDAQGPTEFEVAYTGDALHEPASTTTTTTVPADRGDMDADGDAELVAGASRENLGSTRQAGMAIVLNGDPAGLTEDGTRAFSQKGSGIPGKPEAFDRFGSATASGDFDGDGFADVAVSAPYEGLRGSENVGLVSVTPGSADGPVVSRSRQLAPIHLNRVAPGTHFGEGLAAGDFDADGFDDLAVGAPGADWAVVYPGSADGLVRADATVWTQETQGVPGRAADDPYLDRFGFAVAAGDANGDGFDDLAVGAPWDAEDRGYASGSVTMLYGGEDGVTASGAQRWSRDSNGVKNRPRRFGSGPDGSDDLGWQVSLADHDGDGFADLAASAPGTPRWVDGDRRRDAGSVSVLFGSADGITSRDVTIAQDRPGIPGKPGHEDHLGATLATGQTGDGAAELAAAAVGENTVTLLTGASDGFGRDGVTRYDQDTPGVPGKDETEDAFGASLRLSDYDGDGHDDLAVGAPLENERRGAVTVLYTDGGPGLTTTSTWMSQATPGVPGAAEPWDYFGTFF